jgi:hypothetical protein
MGRNIMVSFEEGETLKFRSTGRIFEVKKRTDQFVTLQSLDGLTPPTRPLTEAKGEIKSSPGLSRE